MMHPLPEVLTVVAITCRNCKGAESYHNEDDTLCWCHQCERGYEKLLVSAVELQMTVQVLFDDPDELYATIVRLAEARNVRLPVLTHNTANLANHLQPTKRRFPLGAAPAQTIRDKNAK